MHKRQPLQPKKCVPILAFLFASKVYSKRPILRISAQSLHHTSNHRSHYINSSKDHMPNKLLEATSRITNSTRHSCNAMEITH